VEIQQFEHMKEKVEGCILADMMDRWFRALEGSGNGDARYWMRETKLSNGSLNFLGNRVA
nr:hypothetical protein [Tanacetum cinerariifolium]